MISNAHQLYNTIKICDSKEEFEEYMNVFIPVTFFSSDILQKEDVVVPLKIFIMLDGSCFIEKNNVLQIVSRDNLDEFIFQHANDDFSYAKKIQDLFVSMVNFTQNIYETDPEIQDSEILTKNEKKEMLFAIYNHFNTE